MNASNNRNIKEILYQQRGIISFNLEKNLFTTHSWMRHKTWLLVIVTAYCSIILGQKSPLTSDWQLWPFAWTSSCKTLSFACHFGRDCHTQIRTIDYFCLTKMATCEWISNNVLFPPLTLSRTDTLSQIACFGCNRLISKY